MSSHNLISKDILSEISPQLQQLRLEQGLTLEELQSATHISAKLLKRMENGKCLPFSYFRRLMQFYGKKIHIIFEQ
ncbi:MAG: helix-turn-helix domain-containing protein [Alphaproteobacteria bacterium]|nr:helix-turn-helix domain-containing protein [Alphaproteobacteria bacterium]